MHGGPEVIDLGVAFAIGVHVLTLRRQHVAEVLRLCLGAFRGYTLRLRIGLGVLGEVPGRQEAAQHACHDEPTLEPV